MEKQHSPAPDLLTVLLPSWNIYISRLEERVTTLARVLAASPLCSAAATPTSERETPATKPVCLRNKLFDYIWINSI